MSLPEVNPQQSVAGIAVDPKTLERVIPESRRPDGTVRKQIKIRPGFTPQEDVNRFRGSRQQQLDRNTLPKGHILGWVAPSADSKPKPKAPTNANPDGERALSKSAAKNAKRKAKKVAEKEAVIKASWEDDDEDEVATKPAAPKLKAESSGSKDPQEEGAEESAEVKELADELKELEVK